MKSDTVYFINYPYEQGDDVVDDIVDGIPSGFLREDELLSTAINKLELPEDIEVFKTKQNVKVTSEGYFVACYESDIEETKDE